MIFTVIQHFYKIIDNEEISGTTLAFTILFIGGGLLLYFLSTLFAKLAKIADEIEKEEF